MLESPSETTGSGLIFRVPLYRVQKGLKIDFVSRKAAPKAARPAKAALALATGYRYRQAVESGGVEDFAACAEAQGQLGMGIHASGMDVP